MAKAGWFANPDGSPSLRYFDGVSWSDRTIALGPPQPPAPPPPAPPPPDVPAAPAVPPPAGGRPPFQSGPVVAALVAGLVMGAVIGLALGGHSKTGGHTVVPHAESTTVRPATDPTTRAGAKPDTPATSGPTLALTP